MPRGGGLLVYVDKNIPSRILNGHVIPGDIKILCVEINLNKQKWVIIGLYRPPNMNESYFIDNISRVIDYYSKSYERVIIMGDFNQDPLMNLSRYSVTVMIYITLLKKNVL